MSGNTNKNTNIIKMCRKLQKHYGDGGGGDGGGGDGDYPKIKIDDLPI